MRQTKREVRKVGQIQGQKDDTGENTGRLFLFSVPPEVYHSPSVTIH